MTRAPVRLPPLLVIGLCALAAPATGGAWVVVQEIRLPVEVRTAAGDPVSREIHVGVFHENSSPEPRPILVLNHGRAPSAEGFARVRVQDFEPAARWLTRFGFIVAVPIRIGYGRTGGEDVENSGPCAKKNYPPVYRAAAVQTLAVLEALRRRSDASADRAVIMGQSFGGTTALAVAAMNPPGIQGAINIAGGGGGNPATRPQNPCSPKALRDPQLWQPKVSEYLASLGFRPQ